MRSSMVTRDNQCNQVMFSAFKNVIYKRYKRTLDKNKVMCYIDTYLSKYDLNNAQKEELNNIINKLKTL